MSSTDNLEKIHRLVSSLEGIYYEITRHRQAIRNPQGENPYACKQCAGPLSSGQPINHYAELQWYEQKFREYIEELKRYI